MLRFNALVNRFGDQPMKANLVWLNDEQWIVPFKRGPFSQPGNIAPEEITQEARCSRPRDRRFRLGRINQSRPSGYVALPRWVESQTVHTLQAQKHKARWNQQKIAARRDQ